jgi:hypothetical protein
MHNDVEKKVESLHKIDRSRTITDLKLFGE